MGGGNAQKSAMARQRNMEKASAAKVSDSAYGDLTSPNIIPRHRTVVGGIKEKRLEVELTCKKLWQLLQVFELSITPFFSS